ncbi:cell wall metabolism sensor histidine kinase WalK [Cryobacterium sp. TMS1-20-1]|uniref:sensor histidine kinase n=1 Tax=Cryobacterium sp. TMS1-20-1 TaxID=1259223 RepID=UPI00141B99ED|nr:HAMP domain-containing sensor histidine kinase [Cryobacterium sp. TMS1-20-1]
MARHFEGYARSLLEVQIVVFGALLVVGSALLLSRPNSLDPVLYGTGASLFALMTLATMLGNRKALFQRFSLLVPLVDIVGIRLTALADDPMLSGGALLLMLPIIWIAYSFGPWGFVICLALVAATSPSSFFAGYADFDSKQFTHLVAFPLTMVIMSAAAGVSGTRIHRKRRELAAKTALTEQAVRARDDLIEAVTHELRTPLTSILGNADLVLRASEQAQTQAQTVERRAGVIVRNAEQMETILADLLLARSTGTSQLELYRAATDIRVLIDHSRAASRAAADARQVTIVVTTAAPAWAEVDPNRIRQILDNLFTNAVKYNRIGGTVTVSETRDADTMTFAITDSGCGIAAADRTRVFEPYFRTESARLSTQSGTGLGLGISRDIAQRHGGDLRLAHSSAAGSRFELTRPLAGVTVAPPPLSVSALRGGCHD